jgi:hypothetical protein
MNIPHAKPVLLKAIMAGLFIAMAVPVIFSPLAFAAQPSPALNATNYFLTTNYVVVAVVTSPCPPCATNWLGPINLTATALSSTNILLRWHNQSTNQVNVQIYRRTGGTGRWWLVADVGPGISNVLLSAQPRTSCEFYALGLFPEDIVSVTTSNPPPTNAK